MDHRNLIKAVSKETQNTNNGTSEIDYQSFNRLCPILMYQMVAPSSVERHGCIKVHNGATAYFNDPLSKVDNLTDSMYANGLSNTASGILSKRMI